MVLNLGGDNLFNQKLFADSPEDDEVLTSRGGREISEPKTRYRGVWSATAVTYRINDIVVNNNLGYICILEHQNHEPPNITYWAPFAETVILSDEVVVASDGSGDYTDIQSGINALSGNAGTVRVKAGTYTITSDILMGGDGQEIVGSGWGTIITTGTTGVKLINGNGHNRINISDVKIDGTDKATTTGVYINGDDCRVRNCWIEDCATNGINLFSGNRNMISQCYINSCAGNGISAGGQMAQILQCHITNCGTSGYNSAINSTSINCLIQQCYIDTCRLGIYVNTNAGSILGCVITNCVSYGIFLTNAYEIMVVGNVLRQNGADSPTHKSQIYLYSTNVSVISSNDCTIGYAYGIEINDAASDRNVLMGNYLRANDDGAILNNGTLTQIAHNITE